MNRATVFASLLSTIAAWIAAPVIAQPAAQAQAAVIVFLDRAQVLRDSAAGKSLLAQTEQLAKQMESDFAPENQQLQADVAKLQSEAAATAPDERQRRVQDLESRRQAFQKRLQDRQTAIQAAQATARTDIEVALGPILEQLMRERGANLLIDRGLVVLGSSDLDITRAVIAQLDGKLPAVTVKLGP